MYRPCFRNPPSGLLRIGHKSKKIMTSQFDDMTSSIIRDWPEIRKLEITLSEFFPISEDWSKLGTPNLARIFLMKSYRTLQIARVIAFTVSKLLRENQQGVGKIIPAHTHTHTHTHTPSLRLRKARILKTIKLWSCTFCIVFTLFMFERTFPKSQRISLFTETISKLWKFWKWLKMSTE